MAKTAYVLGSRIAQGGMAEIYLGKAVGEDDFKRIVAIKRILPHYSNDKEFVQMFRDEAHICKRLQHANIVQVYDFCDVEGSFALIMEHVDGADFRTLLSACEGASRRMSVPMVLYVVACAARGLHYAHTKTDDITHQPLGIIHRDISPQNILISYEGEVKITDFGIASAEDKVTETRPGVVKGKYSYMSPEQVAAKHLDGRSDIFALAIVLWEALAMKRLFAGKTEVETIRRVQNCEITSNLRDYNSEVDDELYQIVMRGLAKETKARYQTAADFEKTLFRYLHSHYPEFLSSELGDFLKQILAKKWDESREAQRKTLTSTDLNTKKQPVFKRPGSSLSEIDFGNSQEGQKPIMPVTGSRSSLNPSLKTSPIKKPRSNLKKLNSALHLKPAKKKASPFKKLVAPTILIGIIVAALSVHLGQKDLFSFLKTVEISVKTEPSAVIIYLDGRNIQAVLEDSQRVYTLTPYTLKIPADDKQHRVEIRRPGFGSKFFSFEADPEKPFSIPPIRLPLKPGAKMVSLTIESPSDIEVNIDNGLAYGRVPLHVESLFANTNHTIVFREVPTGKPLRCVFSPSKLRGRSFRLVINPKSSGQKCRTIPR